MGRVATIAIYALMLCVVKFTHGYSPFVLTVRVTVHLQILVFSFLTISGRLVQVIPWFTYLLNRWEEDLQNLRQRPNSRASVFCCIGFLLSLLLHCGHYTAPCSSLVSTITHFLLRAGTSKVSILIRSLSNPEAESMALRSAVRGQG